MTEHLDTDGIFKDFEEEPSNPPIPPEIQAYIDAALPAVKKLVEEMYPPMYPSTPIGFSYAPPQMEFFCTVFYRGCFNELGELLNKGWHIQNSIPRSCGTEFQILFILCREKENNKAT